MVEKLHGIGLFVAGWIFFPGAFLLLQYLWHFTLTGIKLGKKYGLTDKDRAAISNKYSIHYFDFHHPFQFSGLNVRNIFNSLESSQLSKLF